MFDLKRPCGNCPFRKGQGEKFNLGTKRVLEIVNATAFQCHKTVDYDRWEDTLGRQGEKPQQCAGLMSLLHRAKLDNQIMQIAQRIGGVTFDDLDHTHVYENIADALEAHSWGEDWVEETANYFEESDPEPEPLVAGVPTRARMPDIIRAWEAPSSQARGESTYR